MAKSTKPGSRPKLSRLDELSLARKNWEGYEVAKVRGHADWCARYKRCEDFYFGGGRQWSQEDRDYIESQGRPLVELNEIKKAVDAAVGYQIQNRVDISFRAVGGLADAKLAELHTKVLKHVFEQNNATFKETKMFEDGAIGGRGYLNVRMCYEKSALGRIVIGLLDPMDVVPSSDANEYDPDSWEDVRVLKWMTSEQLVAQYGADIPDLAQRLRDSVAFAGEANWGEDDMSAPRNSFGSSGEDSWRDMSMVDEQDSRRYRVIDRQWHSREMCNVMIFNDDDVRVIDGMPPERVAELQAQGGRLGKRNMRIVRWTVTTRDIVLLDTVSPYEHFTVVPFFFTFRRGLTSGMVENAIDLQITLNKFMSQYQHIVNTTANSGWKVEEDSLVNMDVEELEEAGARTGLVVEYKKGMTPPEKIEPNQIPSGILEMLNLSSAKLKEITVPDVAQGQGAGPEISGIAIQTKQHAAQKQLAIALDNLSQTRNLLARRVHSLVQRFYTYPTILRITEQDPLTGKDVEQRLHLNAEDPEDPERLINDLTVGTYDVVLADQPHSATFNESQFTQVMEMVAAGVPIPPSYIVKYSMLKDKAEIIEQMQKAAAAPAPQANPLEEAKVQLVNAQAELARAKAVESGMDALFSSLNTAQVITVNPAASGIADKLAKSAGFQDKDAAPIVPELGSTSPLSQAASKIAPGQPNPDPIENPLSLIGVAQNTSPNSPPNPDRGLMEGSETGEI